MLVFSHVKPEDIDFILTNLWARGEEEAVLYGLKSKEEMSRHLLGMSHKYGFCLSAGTEPVAAFGGNSSDGHRYTTWFIATDKFVDHALGITKFLRGFIRERISERSDAELELISATGHPDAGRWFNALGFVRKCPPNGVFTTYSYAPSLKDG